LQHSELLVHTLPLEEHEVSAVQTSPTQLPLQQSPACLHAWPVAVQLAGFVGCTVHLPPQAPLQHCAYDVHSMPTV